MFLSELPGIVIKGLNIEDFKSTVKQHVKATDKQPSIAEYWQMYYDSMKVAVAVYFQVLEEVVAQV
jgi:hypothetical protein